MGKSTFMLNIAQELMNEGYDVEFHCCSADDESLDGVVIPALKIALIDGTAPHIVDPKHPGAVDEIVHLGQFWDEDVMISNREAIVKANREISRLYRRAYHYLAAAKLFLDEVEDFYRENNALNLAGLDKMALQIIKEIFNDHVYVSDNRRRERHLFATAITPAGFVSHLDTLIPPDYKRYIISGDDGTGKNELIARIKDAAVMRSYFVEAFHCALDPHKIDHIIIPGLKVAVLNSVTPHILTPRPEDTVVETDAFVKSPGAGIQKERDVARELYQRTFDIAVQDLSQTKAVHDQLESYYIPNMRFKEINRLGRIILDKILALSAGIS